MVVIKTIEPKIKALREEFEATDDVEEQLKLGKQINSLIAKVENALG